MNEIFEVFGLEICHAVSKEGKWYFKQFNEVWFFRMHESQWQKIPEGDEMKFLNEDYCVSRYEIITKSTTKEIICPEKILNLDMMLATEF